MDSQFRHWSRVFSSGYCKSIFKASGKEIPYEIVDKRPGDVAACYVDPRYAKEVLGWEAKLGLSEMCADSWRWQSMNLDGYN